MSSDNKGSGGSSGSGERTPITHRTSSISIQSTTTRIVNTGNNMSVHSTHNSVDFTSNMSSVDGDEDILSIEQTLEQVAASQSNNNRATRTRAGFNSISDALGNLRSRLHRHASSSGQSTSNGRRSVLQRLQDRLHVLDAAHSSRMPLHIMENRRNSMPNLMIHHQEGKEEEEREKEEEEENNDSARHRLTAASAPPLQATIFRIDTRETAHYEESIADGDGSNDRRTNMHRRSSVLFASRIVANRSIIEGSSNILLASGGDGAQTSRRDLLGDRGLSSTGSLRDFEMHVHPSISRRMLSPIAGSDLSGSETTISTTTKDLADDEELSMSVDDEEYTETEDAEEVVVDTTKSQLYSWGKGPQSLHDDSEDRIPTFGQDDTQKDQLMKVTSRLESKAILAVATGQHHSAAVTSQGSLYVAGKNVHGCVDPVNLSEGEVTSRPMLLDCISHIRVLQVSCGYDHTAVLTSNGSVLTWGSNMYGQLGHRNNGNLKIDSSEYKGPINCRPTGLALGKGRKASSVACGTNYTLVLTQQMSLLACGIPTIAGHRETSQWGTPQEIPSLIGVPLVEMSAGDGHAAVISAHGTVFIWGENRNGCCGRISSKAVPLPVPVKTPPKPYPNRNKMVAEDTAIIHAACGLEHTVFGQLGISASDLQSTSKLVSVNHPKGGTFVSVEAGNGHSLLLDSDGDLWLTFATGLQCILQEKSVLSIAAAGDDNCIAITSSSKLTKTLQRQFSVSVEMQKDPAKPIVDAICDDLLAEIECDEDKTPNVEGIANKLEELLHYPQLLNMTLNPKKLDTMFENLLHTGDVASRQVIANSIEKGMKLGLESLHVGRLMYPEAVRCLLSYIKFFDIRRDKDIVFDVKGELICLYCNTILNIPFEGFRALHDFVLVYTRGLFISSLVKPLLITLNSCAKFSVDDNEVEHYEPSRRAVPVIVAVLSWLHSISEEMGLSEPSDFYSDAVSTINTETLFEDLYRMKKASPHEKSKHFFLTAHPFLLSPGCKRNLLQMESQVAMFKTMMSDVDVTQSEIKVDPFYCLEIEREHLLKQALEKIKEADPKDLRKRLRVSFDGEEGLDAGGVTKEFFQLLSEELFDLNSGLWSTKYGDINWFNSNNNWDESGYEMIGTLVGLALYNSVLLDVRFPLAVYRKILGLPLGLEDIMDEELRRGLKQLLDYEGNDVEDIFCLTFELNWMDEMGEEQRLELIPDGANIEVTNANREEYVLRYVRWILVDSIRSQWDAFQTGVMHVMEDSSLDLFLPEELELLVVGTPFLDFNALEENTKYEGGYDKESEVVKNFWKFVKEADEDSQVNLLKFVTSCSKAPIGGLGKMDFVIQRSADSDQLPTSHTCFNTILLPDYGADYEKLAKLLGRAIIECEGFGLE